MYQEIISWFKKTVRLNQDKNVAFKSRQCELSLLKDNSSELIKKSFENYLRNVWKVFSNGKGKITLKKFMKFMVEHPNTV